MKRLSVLGTLGLVVTLGMSSCGGGSSGSCGKVQPCGGDPTGMWKFQSVCGDEVSMSMDATCPGASQSTSGLSVSGTVAFNADNSFTETATISGAINMTIPTSCLAAAGTPLSCADLQGLFQAGGAGSGFSSASCSGTTTCTCHLTISQMVNDSGTWAKSGTDLTLTSTANGDSGGSYCVQGNELHLITLDTTMTMGAMGTAKITSDIVATKQ